MLAITLGRTEISELASSDIKQLSVDLAAQTIVCDERIIRFEISVGDKHSLVQGIDTIAATLKHKSMIKNFRQRDKSLRP